MQSPLLLLKLLLRLPRDGGGSLVTILWFRVGLGPCVVELYPGTIPGLFWGRYRFFIDNYKFAQETGAKFVPQTALPASSFGDLWALMGEQV